MTQNSYTGSCHCGRVTWQVSAPIESVTACNCTLCRRYGALWAYGHIEQDVKVEGLTKQYERGNKHNAFHFCESCGCLAYYLANKENEEGYYRVAVNLRMTNDPEPIMYLPIDHFDGLDSFDDLPRDDRCIKNMWF